MPLKPKVRKSDCLFCPTNTPKPTDLQFIITKDKDKQQVLTRLRIWNWEMFLFVFLL